ncbi:MAG: YwiC-like family protein [Candidatus Microthrix sp.]|nr:YwiC-like family protein [Candidatus Microthrix sp.]MBK9559133.1 YwiC-like family protein [Candidatus Microthrix sp.]
MTNIDQRPTSSDAESAASSGAAAPPPAAAPRAKQRSPLRTVALPSEHGGWGLTLEPVLLGLLVAHSVSAFCIGLAAVLAFLARTPLKLAVVDARRGRTLERTRMARKVAAAELAVLAVLVVVAFLTATPGFWWPIFGIAPLLLVELSYDIRSRSRRLIPELAGAVGIAGVAAMMALAGGLDTAVALGLWAVLAGRAIAAIPTIRSQVLKLHGRPTNDVLPVVADLVALALVAATAVAEPALLAGAVAVAVAIVAQRALIAWAPTERAVVLGIRQTVMGLAVVIATAVGVGLA